MELLNAPIPGQSLTDTPRNYPWERPPEMNNVEEVTKHYIEKLADQDAMDDLAVLMDSGLPISVFVQALMTVGVSKGKHTIDVGLIVAPVLHKFIKAAMTSYGVDALDNYVSKEELSKERERKRTLRAISLAIGKSDQTEGDPGVDMLEDIRENLEQDDASMEPTEGDMVDAPQEEEETTPKTGLMAKGAQ